MLTTLLVASKALLAALLSLSRRVESDKHQHLASCESFVSSSGYLLRVQNNGAGVSRCSGVAPGVSNSTDSPKELCCFPYLTGNAVFPACNGAGLGLYQHVDVEHIVQVKRSESAGALQDGIENSSGSRTPGTQATSSFVAVIDLDAEGLTGELTEQQVSYSASLYERVLSSTKTPHPLVTLVSFYTADDVIETSKYAWGQAAAKAGPGIGPEPPLRAWHRHSSFACRCSAKGDTL